MNFLVILLLLIFEVVELDKRLLEGQRDLMSIVLSKPELELGKLYKENTLVLLSKNKMMKSP